MFSFSKKSVQKFIALMLNTSLFNSIEHYPNKSTWHVRFNIPTFYLLQRV